jgi:hypothetical protein
VSVRVLFLDFDGVLNGSSYEPILPQGHIAPAFRSIEWLAYQLQPELCAMVAEICRRAEAALVLSTTWRNAFPLPQIAELLESLGMPIPIGATPRLQASTRAREIQRWIHEAAPTRFVVLDDDPMDVTEVSLRLVQTDSEVGIRRRDVERCVELFSGS